MVKRLAVAAVVVLLAGCGGGSGDPCDGRPTGSCRSYEVTFSDIEMDHQVWFATPEPDADYAVEDLQVVGTSGKPHADAERCDVQRGTEYANLVVRGPPGHGASVTFLVVLTGLRNGG